MANSDKKSIDLLKVILCSVALCVLMALMLSVYSSWVPEKVAQLEEKGNMDNMIWFVEYVTPILPVIILTAVLYVFYSKKEAYLPVITQREQGYITLWAALFTFFVMLPYVYLISQGEGSAESLEEGEEVAKTLFETTFIWFVVQIIPFTAKISYHFMRASAEEKESLENE